MYQSYYQVIDPKKVEKKNLMLYSNVIGGAMLGILAMQTIVVYIYEFAVAIFKGLSLAETANLMTNDVFLGYSLNTLACFAAFIVPFSLAVFFLRRDIGQVCEFEKPKSFKLCVYCFGASMIMILAGSMLTNMFSTFTSTFFGVEPVQGSYGDGTYTIGSWLFMFLNIAIAPALVEEFAFRGVALGLFRKFGDLPAIIMSSLLFALMHGNFVQIPYTFCLGLAMATTRVITGSIWPGVFIHFFNNAFSCIMEILPDAYFSYASLAFTAFCIGFGIFGMIKLVRGKHFREVKDVPSTMKKSQRFFRMIGSPAMIIALVLLLIEAMTMFTSV